MHFWSRSREELWHKGETSGNVQRLRALRYDCDADALLALVEPAGPACHTGERTCFHDGDLEPRRAARGAARAGAHDRRARGRATPTAATRPSCSQIRARIGEKVREEAEEVARAAAAESDERVREEAADVLYHLAVLLRPRATSLRSPTPSRSSMPVAADLRPSSPSLDEARALAASTTWCRCATRSSTTSRRPCRPS